MTALITGGHRFLHAGKNLKLTWGIMTDFTEGTLHPVSLAGDYKTPQENMSQEHYVALKRTNVILQCE